MFNLALKSLHNRWITSLLTVLSIALSASLLLSVERTRRAAADGFTQSISQVDLLVGGRTGPVSLLLFNVFNIGNPTVNVSAESFDHFAKSPAVEWAVPISLGDAHKGYRVLATTPDYFKYYRFRGEQKIELQSGTFELDDQGVAIGSEVAAKLKYQIGSAVIITHGVTRGEGVLNHDEHPFKVSGVLRPTGTLIDRTVYMSLEAHHELHEHGGHHGEDHAQDHGEEHENEHDDHDHAPGMYSAFFLRLKNRVDILGLQREINEYKAEPLTAVIPGVVLAELWQNMGVLEKSLRAISWLVLGVGLLSMLISLMTSLKERRREMAILRAVGAGPKHILRLMMFEAALLAGVGLLLGLVIEVFAFEILRGWLESNLGLFLSGPKVTMYDLWYLLAAWICGLLLGLIPAMRAARLALKDGLSLKL